MATTKHFARKWIDVTWTPQDKKYQYLFPDGGDLSIAENPETFELYILRWADQNGRQHLMSFSPADQADSHLTTRAQLVDFECTVTLSIGASTPANLMGTITRATSSVGEGPVGTFTAIADPTGEESQAHRKSSRWLRWLRQLFHRRG